MYCAQTKSQAFFLFRLEAVLIGALGFCGVHVRPGDGNPDLARKAKILTIEGEVQSVSIDRLSVTE